MIKIDLMNARRIFDTEVNYELNMATMNTPLEESEKIKDAMNKKVIHTNEVIQDGLKVAKELSFNESIRDFTHVALMDHDIGRFAQMRYTGNYQDYILFEKTGIKNHGVLGKNILGTLINYQLPNAKELHQPIMTIVNDHVDKINNDEELMILATDLLKEYSIEELLLSDKVSKNLISAITQIVQDVDRLDIYHQILEDRWTPMKVENKISPVVFEMFYNGEYLDMASLRKTGLWNANVGELVRLGFINQIKLLSVAKIIKRENIIMKLKEKRQNPKVLDAFDYANEKLNEMIKNSTDGVTLGK